MPKWLPGQSGNYQGRPKRRSVEDEVKFRLAMCRGRDRKEIAQALIECAKLKRPWALKLICDLDALKAKATDFRAEVHVDEMTSEQRLARLNELLDNPQLCTLVEAQIAAKKRPEALQ